MCHCHITCFTLNHINNHRYITKYPKQLKNIKNNNQTKILTSNKQSTASCLVYLPRFDATNDHSGSNMPESGDPPNRMHERKSERERCSPVKTRVRGRRGKKGQSKSKWARNSFKWERDVLGIGSGVYRGEREQSCRSPSKAQGREAPQPLSEALYTDTEYTHIYLHVSSLLFPRCVFAW